MQKIYRYALFGRTSAGKSSILAAMSLFHRKHPDGLTVTWVPDAPIDSTDPEVLEQYRDGKRVLEAAREAIVAGEVPRPNVVGPIIRYRFDFTAPTGYCPHAAIAMGPEVAAGTRVGETTRGQDGRTAARKYAVEFIDYSGEMLDPKVNADSLSVKLRSQLAELDGMFVLAEAPLPGHEGDRLYAEFELLQQAFALLEAEREKTKVGIRTPVGVLFNKWDRRHAQDSTLADRALQLEAFLNGTPEPPHRTLLDQIQGTVAEGCFQKFAVSAFGKARREKRTDIDSVETCAELPPLGRPLPSFGLEDPFVWAARTRDEIDVSDYEEAMAKLAFANPLPWFGLDALAPVGPAKACRKGLALAARFPRGTEPRRQIRSQAAKALRVAALRAVTLGCFLLVALLGLEASLDLWRFRETRADIARPEATQADLARHQATLNAYITSHDLRHVVSRLFMSRSEAQSLLALITDHYEDVAWAPVEALAPDAVGQEGPAEGYLAIFPNGKHASEASTIVQQASILRKQQTNTVHMEAVDAEITALGGADRPGLDAVLNLSKRIDEWPHPDQRKEAHKQAAAAAHRRVSALIARIGQKEREQRVQDLLAAKQAEKAGLLVKELVDAGGDQSHYARLMMLKAGDIVAGCRNGKRWDEIRTLCGQIKRGWQELGLLDRGQINTITSWEAAATSAWDRELYQDVYTQRSLQSCSNYLDSSVPADRRRMDAEVRRFRDHLLKLAGQLTLDFQVRKLTTGSWNLSKGNVTFSYRLVGRFRGEIGNEWVSDRAYEGTTGPLDQQALTAGLDDKLTLELSLTHERSGTTTDLGQTTLEGSLRDLVYKEVEFPLTPMYKVGGNRSKVLLELRGVPEAPDLPAYPNE